MKPTQRFIKSVVETAKSTDVKLPWQRQTRHQTRIMVAKSPVKVMRKA